MVNLEYAEVVWMLNAHCKFQCSYCQSQFKNGGLDHSLEQYLTIVEKLQHTRYAHHASIHWTIGGGEPLHFPHLSAVLKKIKQQPSTVHLSTSGDDSWFSLYSVIGLIDSVELTYHAWQNDDVFDFVLEQCAERQVNVSIIIPLIPGAVTESRARVQQYVDRGYTCNEQVLHDADGQLHRGYSTVDDNRIHGRPDDFVLETVVFDPNVPDPNYIDLSVANSVDPVYTGSPCYAGVDWLYIGHKGFASYSMCSGRNEHCNVFDPAWQPPAAAFACTVNQCRNEQDRKKIRIIPILA